MASLHISALVCATMQVSELKELVDSLGDSPEKRRQAFGPFGQVAGHGMAWAGEGSLYQGWHAQVQQALQTWFQDFNQVPVDNLGELLCVQQHYDCMGSRPVGPSMWDVVNRGSQKCRPGT